MHDSDGPRGAFVGGVGSGITSLLSLLLLTEAQEAAFRRE